MTPHTAEAMRDTGQQMALFKAGPEWSAQAIHFLRLFLTEHVAAGEDEFTFEQFRLHAEQCGLKAPASLNAWGALPRIAIAAGICQPTSKVVKASRPASHARMIRVWRAA